MTGTLGAGIGRYAGAVQVNMHYGPEVGSHIHRVFPLNRADCCCNVLTGCLAISYGYRSDGGINDVTPSDGYVIRYLI